VARAAADLLVSPERALVRECASGTCSWLFVDRSRTHQRRWCSMKTCGNRAKARRFYTRRREAETRQ
jgi:predicted RNA-binding Zn ribbon-like protein